MANPDSSASHLQYDYANTCAPRWWCPIGFSILDSRPSKSLCYSRASFPIFWFSQPSRVSVACKKSYDWVMVFARGTGLSTLALGVGQLTEAIFDAWRRGRSSTCPAGVVCCFLLDCISMGKKSVLYPLHCVGDTVA